MKKLLTIVILVFCLPGAALADSRMIDIGGTTLKFEFPDGYCRTKGEIIRQEIEIGKADFMNEQHVMFMNCRQQETVLEEGGIVND